MFHPLPMYLAGTWLIFPWLFRQKSPKVLASLATYLQYLGKYPTRFFSYLSPNGLYLVLNGLLPMLLYACMHVLIEMGKIGTNDLFFPFDFALDICPSESPR